MEVSGTAADVSLYYNVLYDGGSFICLQSAASVTNLKIENNTVVQPADQSFANALFICRSTWASGVMTWKNNVFYTSVNVITGTIGFTHLNNDYYVFDGASIGFTPDSSEKTDNPQFVDLTGKNLRLKNISTCINAGLDLAYTLDFDGVSVPRGGKPDMGAYEHAIISLQLLTRRIGDKVSCARK